MFSSKVVGSLVVCLIFTQTFAFLSHLPTQEDLNKENEVDGSDYNYYDSDEGDYDTNDDDENTDNNNYNGPSYLDVHHSLGSYRYGHVDKEVPKVDCPPGMKKDIMGRCREVW